MKKYRPNYNFLLPEIKPQKLREEQYTHLRESLLAYLAVGQIKLTSTKPTVFV